MQKKAIKQLRCDGGYGLTGNIVREWYITQLSKENQEKYEAKLKKESPKQYEEFKEWMKLTQ